MDTDEWMAVIIVLGWFIGMLIVFYGLWINNHPIWGGIWLMFISMWMSLGFKDKDKKVK